jgi:protocatechuate 3,4-dioxygenase beta subunit
MNHCAAFTRRRFISIGFAIATTLQLRQAARAIGVAPEAGSCTLIPEQEVGPFYIADELLRSEIAEGKAGVPLVLRILVLDARTCKPLSNAAVDVWHCDALGLYSGFTNQNPMGPGRFGRPTDKLRFLRGIQLAGPDGIVSFRTVFPGFYMGRTNHIHVKVRTGGHTAGKSYQAGHTSHTGQIFFPEETTVRIMQRDPYSSRTVKRTNQAEDWIFSDQHGESSIAHLQALHAEDLAAGLQADIVAAIDPVITV